MARKALFLLITVLSVSFFIFELWKLLDLGVHYDEAYTLLNYVLSGVSGAITTYDMPNNHILNSVLLALQFKILDFSILSLHLVSFLSFVISLLLGLKLVRSRSGKIIWIFLFSVPSIFIHYSVEARGYGLQGLFMLLAIYALENYEYTQKNESLRRSIRWIVLAFWTVPTFLYMALMPVAPVLNWAKPKTERWPVFKEELIAGIKGVLWVVFLYVPILFYVAFYGVKMGGDTVGFKDLFIKLPSYFWNLLNSFFAESFWLVIVGFVGVYFHLKLAKKVLWALAVAVLICILTKSLPPYDRLWLPFFVLLTLYSAEGWGILIKKAKPWLNPIFIVIPVICLSAYKYKTNYSAVKNSFQTEGELLSVYKKLSELIKPGDYLVAPVAYKDQMRAYHAIEGTGFLRWRLFNLEEHWRMALFLVYDDTTKIKFPIEAKGSGSKIYMIKDGSPNSPVVEAIKGIELSNEVFRSQSFFVISN